MKSVAHRLLDKRVEAKGWSWAELARLCGVDRSTFSRIRNSAVAPGRSLSLALKTHLDIDPALWDEPDAPETTDAAQ